MNDRKLSDEAECTKLVGDIEEQESVTSGTDQELPMLASGRRRPTGEASDFLCATLCHHNPMPFGKPLTVGFDLEAEHSATVRSRPNKTVLCCSFKGQDRPPHCACASRWENASAEDFVS